MTRKKQQILQAALKLFAHEGYQNTPTSKIAREANVSEGLIFKHFKNKEGLLDAVINMMKEDIEGFIKHIKNKDKPKEVINAVFEFPPLVSDNKDFWRLQFSLQYQCPDREQYQKEQFSTIFKDILTKAFIALGYEQPEMESVFLMSTLWQLCQEDCNNTWGKKYVNFTRQEYIDFVKSKHDL